MPARARRDDPETSRAAAASIPEQDLTDAQARILALLVKHGPLSDTEIRWHYDAMAPHWPNISDSGLRSRRAELVEAGRVEDSGSRSLTPSKRVCVVWRAVPEGLW